MAKKQPEPGFESLLEKARRFCLYRERSRHETEQKIRTWGVPSSLLQKLMQALEDEKFINDGRFAEIYARSKFNTNKWGKVKIKTYLAQFRIDRGYIDDALGQIPDDRYEQTAFELARKKAATLKADEDAFSRQVKITHYLLQKGFEAPLVKRAVEQTRPS